MLRAIGNVIYARFGKRGKKFNIPEFQYLDAKGWPVRNGKIIANGEEIMLDNDGAPPSEVITAGDTNISLYSSGGELLWSKEVKGG